MCALVTSLLAAPPLASFVSPPFSLCCLSAPHQFAARGRARQTNGINLAPRFFLKGGAAACGSSSPNCLARHAHVPVLSLSLTHHTTHTGYTCLGLATHTFIFFCIWHLPRTRRESTLSRSGGGGIKARARRLGCVSLILPRRLRGGGPVSSPRLFLRTHTRAQHCDEKRTPRMPLYVRLAEASFYAHTGTRAHTHAQPPPPPPSNIRVTDERR